MVYAVRRKREGESIFKKATAAIFYRMLDRITDTPIPLDTGDFRLMSRRALEAFLSLPEQARFIRGMVAWIGFRQVPFVYDRPERLAGETKYPLGKMVRFALDAVTGFSTAPLRFASHVGLALTGASLLLFVYIVDRLADRQRGAGLDLDDAGRGAARRGADVRARHDRRISRPALCRIEAAAALSRRRYRRPGAGPAATPWGYRAR